MNKKGISGPIISVFLMIGVLGFIMITFVMYGLVGPPIADTFNTVTKIFEETSEGDPNLANATAATFTNINPGFQNLQWVSYTLLVFLFIGFIFLAFFVRAYPFLIIFWIGGMIVLIFSAILIADSYNAIASGPLGSVYQAWGTNHFLMSNLPHIFTVMGFLGGFILFVIASRSSDVEGGPL